jgi:23S rRNA-intervening sequence protein
VSGGKGKEIIVRDLQQGTRMKPEGFKELIVWQKAFALTLEVYETTKAFPREAQYGLVSQLRRAAVSVAANIADGYK